MKFEGFIGASYQTFSGTLDCQRCINLFPEMDQEGKNVIALFPTPGKRLFATCGSGPIRGGFADGSTLYVVSGGSFYRVTSTGAATSIGSIGGTGAVGMDKNSAQIFISAGTQGYIYTFATASLTAISDPDFPGSIDGKFTDDYFVFFPGGSGRFYITALNDGSSIDPLDFASAEGSPDYNVGIGVLNREIWLFGASSTEIWWDSGAADFPFERVSGGFIEHGCGATRSIAKVNSNLFWLACNKDGGNYVLRSEQYGVRKISTPAVDYALGTYSSTQDAIGYGYSKNGHEFYVLNFPSGNTSWAYDTTTGLWHERQYRNATTGATECDRGVVAMTLNDGSQFRTIVGDKSNGNLYELRDDYYSDNGDPIVRRRATRHVYLEKKRMTHSKLIIEFEPGVGLTTGQGSDPQAILRYSDDGGFTWSTERWVDIGVQGAYGTVSRWRRLGIPKDRVYEVTVTDPVKVCMIDAAIEVSAHGE